MATAPLALCFLLRPHGTMASPDPNDEPADNSFCYVCHVNFKKEPLAEQHRKAGVGCMDCHGFSDDHSADEDGVTPPNVMYPPDRINPSCMKCHQPGGSKAVRAGTIDPRRDAVPHGICTTCHGAHRLVVRTRRWDKVSGKLIHDDGVRMTHGADGGM